MNAVAMLVRCYRRQHPEDYGGEVIQSPYLPSPGSESATGFSEWPLTEQCDRCGINHAAPGTVPFIEDDPPP